MATYFSIGVFKIILILLLAINCVLIYFQFYGQINTKRFLFEKSEQNFNIHNLMNNRLVDKEEKISDSVEKESNVPLKYYNEWKGYPKDNNWKKTNISTCDTELPSIEEIDFNNIFWQTIPNTNKTQYFLYNAFYDNRGNDKYVRVVVMQRDPSRRNLWSVY